MGITLIEASKNNRGDVVKSSTMEMFARASDILAAIPFETIVGGVVKYEQEGSLPGVAFRGVNESYVQSAGILNPKMDATYIVGGDVDVDRYLLTTRGAAYRSAHTSMKIKAIADTFAVKVIKGSNESDPREFDGLQTRITGAQLVDAGATSGGDALSMVKLDEAIDAVDNPTHLIMNKTLRRLILAYLRKQGSVQMDRDAFGRPLMFYRDLPILTTNNGSTEALPFTEANPGGGSSVGTSIYCVSFGSTMLTGIQSEEMSARDLGEVHDKPVARLRVEWYAGLAAYHGRCAARLRGIKNAAVVD